MRQAKPLEYFAVHTGAFDAAKVLDLEDYLEAQGCEHAELVATGILTRLWRHAGKVGRDDGWVASVGRLRRLRDELKWSGNLDQLVTKLIEFRFVDERENELFIHDWAESQPAIDKRLRARKAFQAKQDEKPNDCVDSAQTWTDLDRPSESASAYFPSLPFSSSDSSSEGGAGGRAPPGPTADEVSAAVDAWNQGIAEGSNVRPIRGTQTQRDSIRLAMRARAEWRDPQAWLWAARAISTDQHHGRKWAAPNRFGWLMDPKKKFDRFAKWVDAGTEIQDHGAAKPQDSPPKRESAYQAAKRKADEAVARVQQEAMRGPHRRPGDDDGNQRRIDESSGGGDRQREPASILALLGPGPSRGVG